MSIALEKAVGLLAAMSPEDASALFEQVALKLNEGFPGIESDPDICGGDARIVRTRIPVWILEQGRRLGMSDAELLRSYPSLRLADLSNAWRYVRTQQDEIERAIRENEDA